MGTLQLRFLCKPRFVVDRVERESGTGFLLQGLSGEKKTYLLTAQHLFSVPWKEMPRRVTAAKCMSPTSGDVLPAGPAIAIEGAHPMGPLNELKDIAAFPLSPWSPGLRLASIDVRPGDDVWLLAAPASGREVGTLLHHAVVGRSAGFLVYAFDDTSIGLDQTSGGAVLNHAGEVVGSNVGYGRLPDGRTYGVANRLSTILSVVRALDRR